MSCVSEVLHDVMDFYFRYSQPTTINTWSYVTDSFIQSQDATLDSTPSRGTAGYRWEWNYMVVLSVSLDITSGLVFLIALLIVNTLISWVTNYLLILARNFSVNFEFHLWNYKKALVTFDAKFKSKIHDCKRNLSAMILEGSQIVYYF